MKSQIKFWLNWLIVLTIIFRGIYFPNSLYAQNTGKDVSDIIKIIEVKANQNGKPTNEIVFNNDVNFEIKFAFPSISNAKNGVYVKPDDYANIYLSEGFELTEEAKIKKKLIFKDGDNQIHIASYNFALENKKIVLKIKFDGDDKALLEDQDIQFREVSLSSNFKIDKDYVQSRDKEIRILGNLFKILIPPKFTVNINGNVEKNTNHNIKWTVDITGKRKDENINFKDYVFFSNLEKAGNYVDGSFRVNGEPKAVMKENNAFKYIFEDLTEDIVKISFETKLTPEEFRGDPGVEKENTVSLFKENNKFLQDIGRVNWKPNFSKKTVLKHGDKTYYKENEKYRIDWEIEINQVEAELENVVIKDVLQKKSDFKLPLKFIEAKKSIWNGNDWEESIIVNSSNIDDNIYTFNIGNIDKKTKLTITSELDEKLSEFAENKFFNEAYIGWDGLNWEDARNNNYIRRTASTTIGEGIITKGGENQPIDKGTAYTATLNEWVIEVFGNGVESSEEAEKLRVFDLMIFDKSVNYDNYDKGRLELEHNDYSLISKEALNQLTKERSSIRYLKYVDNSFVQIQPSDKKNLKAEVLKVKLDGKYIGDLLVVSGFEKEKTSFKLKTTIAGPMNIMHNEEEQKIQPHISYNRAYLACENKIIDYSDRWVKYRSRMLDKRAISSENAEKFKLNRNIEHINQGIKNNLADIKDSDPEKESLKENAFNHKDGTILYRLSINAANNQNTNISLGNLLVKDTLEEGWEFVDFENGKPYISYQGEAVRNQNTVSDLSSTDSRVIAESEVDISDLLLDNTHKLSADKREISFEFTNMKSPYVILLKARPKKDYQKNVALSEYTVSNKVEMIPSLKEHGDIIWSKKDNQDVKVGTVLSKNIINTEDEKGFLNWKIDYKPYDIVEKSENVDLLYLEDTISQGMEIRKIDGITDVKIQKVELNADGTEKSSEIINDKSLIEYDETQRKLKMKIQDHKSYYTFTYTTDIISTNIGEKLSNNVVLIGSNLPSSIPQEKNHIILEDDVRAIFSRKFSINIIKLDSKTKKPLEGVKFSLKKDDIERELTTGEDGKVKFSGLEEGTYELKEIESPLGYDLDSKTHIVIINKSKKPLVSIDGKDGNTIVIENTESKALSGQIEVIKKVTNTSNAEDLIKEFDFSLKLTNLPEYSLKTCQYEKVDISSNQKVSGELKRENDVFKFKLSNDQKIIIKGIDLGSKYELKEMDYSSDYESSSSGANLEGDIDSTPISIIFTNRKNDYIKPPTTTTASLKVEKILKGTGIKIEDYEKDKFKFSIKFEKDSFKEYDYEKTEYYNGIIKSVIGKIKSGDEFTLKSGENIIIKDISESEKYILTELDYQEKGYIPQDEEGNEITDGMFTGEITTAQALNIVKFINKIDAKENSDLNNSVEGPEKSSQRSKEDFETPEENSEKRIDNNDENSKGSGGNNDINSSNNVQEKSSTNTKTDDENSSNKKSSEIDIPEDGKSKTETEETQPKDSKPEQTKDINSNLLQTENKTYEIPSSDIKSPIGVLFKPKDIVGNIPSNKNLIVTLVDEKGIPIGKAELNLQDKTYIFIDDDRKVEAIAKINENNILEILDDEIPKSFANDLSKVVSKKIQKKLPKTGSKQEEYYIIGLILLSFGIGLSKMIKK